MPVAARASLAPLAPPPRRAALAPLPKTARTLPSVIAVAPHRLVAAPIVVARAAPANASTAKIIVTGRHVELTAPLKEYAVSSVVEWGSLSLGSARERERDSERNERLGSINNEKTRWALSALSRNLLAQSPFLPLPNGPEAARIASPPRPRALIWALCCRRGGDRAECSTIGAER